MSESDAGEEVEKAKGMVKEVACSAQSEEERTEEATTSVTTVDSAGSHEKNAHKRAMQFDFEAIFTQTIQNAAQNSADIPSSRRAHSRDSGNDGGEDAVSHLSGSLKASSVATTADGDDGEEEDVGPALPPGFNPPASTSDGTDYGFNEETPLRPALPAPSGSFPIPSHTPQDRLKATIYEMSSSDQQPVEEKASLESLIDACRRIAEEGSGEDEPPKIVKPEDGEEEREGDEDEDEEGDEDEGEVTISSLIPAVCEVNISHGSKPVTALTFDAQGSKFATGSYSYSVQLFEFLKMDSSMKPFREVHPCESHVINDLAYNNNGETLLVASGNAQLKLLDRQGKQWAETIRGDQYLVDLSNTKGHTAAVNACCWHPLEKNEFITCSDDGSLRIWNTRDFKVLTKIINTQKKVIKTKNAGGKRAIPTTCCYSRDGKLIAAGCDDGSIQIWKNGNIFVNTTYMNRKAHSGPITRLVFSPDGQKILSRSMDDSLKLFELKNFKEPLKAVTGLDCMFPQTDCGFSPHGEFVYTAISHKDKSGESGALLFFDSESLDLLYRIDYPSQGCIRAVWHPKINQITVGLTDGTCRFYYDPRSSARGALLCAERPVRRSRQSEVVREEIVLAPLTLAMFQPRGEEGEEKEITEWRIKRFLRMQSGSKKPKFRKPADMPMSGPSAGGRIAAGGGTLHSYIARQLGTTRNQVFMEDTDVRASILRHAEEAEKNPLYVAKAYEKTQPKPIFQEKTTAPEEEDEDAEDDGEPKYKVSKLG